jgi:hypothetical protein
MWRTLTETADRRIGSQNWHRDRDDRTTVKVYTSTYRKLTRAQVRCSMCPGALSAASTSISGPGERRTHFHIRGQETSKNSYPHQNGSRAWADPARLYSATLAAFIGAEYPAHIRG